MIRILLLLFSLIAFQTTFAHGSMESPISRIYNCFKENPQNPTSAACRAAVAEGGRQALYDWNGVNQGAANDKHQDIIADGKLCAGGRDLFKGMNLARDDWRTTTLMPDSNGQVDFTWLATAPHATRYFKFYITKSDYDFTQPLKWSDLEPAPFCTITSVTAQNSRYHLVCPMPAGIGKRTIFVIWQRSDSMEAFYSCSDVVLSNVVTTWNHLDDLVANDSLVAQTKVVFKLYKMHELVQTINYTVGNDQTAANQWPYYLAQTVNANSTIAHIGELNATSGDVVPVMSATANKVYVKDQAVADYHYTLDFIQPNEEINYIYPDGISSYTAGTIVIGRHDHLRYQCKPFPYSGWCSGSELYYEPGKGLAWQQAWILLP